MNNSNQYKKLKEKFESKFIHELNHFDFKNLIHEDEIPFLDCSNMLTFYWFQQCQNYFEILDETNQLPKQNKGKFTDEEEILFDVWQSGPYAKEFLELTQKNSIKISSEKCLKLLRHQLQVFFKLHLVEQLPIAPKNYRLDLDIGDYYKNGQIYLNHTPDIIKHQELELKFLNVDIKNHHKHLKRIKSALAKLSLLAPSSFERLGHFTTHIIPINDAAIVSYSSQELPGYSTINLYHRDDVDLMDDLLHENGHHHLNYFLNTEELIVELEEISFYSPWRKSMRPIRGIYHAFCTFYWAFDLFSQLLTRNLNPHFSQSQIEKIRYRFCEEYLMLDFCIYDLELAYQQNLILAPGQEILLPLFQDLKNKKNFYRKIEDLLNPSSAKRIQKLKQTLASKHQIRLSLRSY